MGKREGEEKKVSIKAGGGGMGCATVVGIVFVTLKLTDNIDWSWVWVLSPWWCSAAFWMTLFVGFILLASLARR